MTPSYLLQLVSQQTWQVALLAALVWFLTRFAIPTRAHLSHMLWALVLIKCITPPIWSSSVGFFSRISAQFSIGQAGHLETETSSPNNQKSEWSEATITLGSDIVPSELPIPNFGKAVSMNAFTSSLVVWLAATLWIIGVCIMTLLSLIRGTIFFRMVQRTRCETPPEVSQCIERLNQRLGLRRKVGVVVVSSSLGPAVFGLLRPVILLPKAIVEGRSSAQLEPLIAHEMIHIRRGDLWLALVQTIACNVGWFHPLVWLASRQLTIESERCCDEETIASLPCKPAAYARSLLEVLELKHQLRVAPALPGVRPVDITLSRLDRIMRLGQGSRSRSPWWVWGIALVSSIVVLPGGCYVAAQTPEAKKEAKQEVRGVSMAPEAPSPLPVPRLTEEEEKAFNGSDIVQLDIKILEIAASSKEAHRLVEWMDKHKVDDTPLRSVAISGPISGVEELNAAIDKSLSKEELRLAQDEKRVFVQPVPLTETVSVPILSEIPYLGRLFKTQRVQLASSTSNVESRRIRMESLTSAESKEFVDSIVEPCQPMIMSSPRMMTVNGMTGTCSVGEFLDSSKTELASGFTISVTSTFVGENDVILGLLHLVKKAATQQPIDDLVPRDESAKDLAASTHSRFFETQARLHLGDTLVIASKEPGANEPYELVMIKCSRYRSDLDK